MKTTDINAKIEGVAEKAKEFNLKASETLHDVAAKAGQVLEETADMVAQRAHELASKAEKLAREGTPKPAPRSHKK